jgi:UDP-GlcNAc:undecaprenyl-phosphate GlcNAc-1-phosphate transferase
MWGYLATVVWLVGLTNLVNLIDGVDGLAGGICLMVMALLLVVGWQSTLVFPIVCAAAACGALVGFLCYNFPPATIYLGDGGAYFLGFLIAILSMVHSQKGTVVAALVAPLFVLALPIVDVGLAILRRGLKGIPIFRPDRRHLHHRLAETGLSRTRVVLMFYGCSLFFLGLALAAFLSHGRLVPVLFGMVCVVLLASAGSFSFSREWFAVGKVVGNSLQVRKETRYALTLTRWFELEAERSGSADELWRDFGFISEKLGFSEVTLVTTNVRKVWQGRSARSQAGDLQQRFELPSAMTLEFSAWTQRLEPAAFELLTELAAETWVKAGQRWQQIHQVPFAFATVSPEPRGQVGAVLDVSLRSVRAET